ncbi:hypothetical protein LCGC14_1912090 [marine sediment metagenome]|uniref:aminodeoxychorismate lyase n=1 Tax=marine sediment metagenome TaxID=412755 RepID=A0A0F9FT67_9ZZZZ
MQVFLNDKLVPESDARVSVLDRGFLYGDSVFETLRAYGGVPFMLSTHLRRLARSADALGIHIPISIDELRSAVMSTLEANSLKSAYLRVMVSRGVGPPGFDPTADTTPTLVVLARELSPYPDEMYTDGVKLIVSPVRRNHPQALDPSIKSGNFLNNILAKADASRAGAYDSVMLSLEGFVAECTSSNIFFARDGVLYTPSTRVGILDGITRETIIAQAHKMNIQVREGEYTLESLMEAEEVFITNTTMEVMPVRAVDDRTFRPGPLAKMLREAYQALINL